MGVVLMSEVNTEPKRRGRPPKVKPEESVKPEPKDVRVNLMDWKERDEACKQARIAKYGRA